MHGWRKGSFYAEAENATVAHDLDYRTYGFTDADWDRPLELTWGMEVLMLSPGALCWCMVGWVG